MPQEVCVCVWVGVGVHDPMCTNVTESVCVCVWKRDGKKERERENNFKTFPSLASLASFQATRMGAKTKKAHAERLTIESLDFWPYKEM